MAAFESYKDRFRWARLERREGVIRIMIHDNGGSARWSMGTAGIHDELGEVFHQVGQDRDNRVVILTGAGDEFLTAFAPPDAGQGPPEINATFWDQIFREGRSLLQNLLEIDVPVIGAVNGPAHIHAELLTMSDLVIASERASFADKAHFPGGVVPADGVHIWWPMLLGPNRGRSFLLTGEEIGAAEAKQLGFVMEVVKHEAVQERAWALAAQLAAKPALTLRFTRAAFTQHIKRRMLDDLGYGLMLEGMGIMGLVGK